MQSRTIALCLIAASLAAPAFAPAQSTVYRWVDKDGKVHFSDAPPPADARDASQKRMGGGDVDDSQLPYATQVAARRFPVLIYTGTKCGDPCARGRELLVKRGVPFAEHDAQNNPADQEALKKLIGSLEVPVLVVGENKTTGYEEGRWHAALDEAGYPRTRLPGLRPLPVPPPPAPPQAPDAASQPASK